MTLDRCCRANGAEYIIARAIQNWPGVARRRPHTHLIRPAPAAGHLSAKGRLSNALLRVFVIAPRDVMRCELEMRHVCSCMILHFARVHPWEFIRVEPQSRPLIARRRDFDAK